MHRTSSISILAFLWLAPLVPAGAKPSLELVRHAPCNLFAVGTNVTFTVLAKGFPEGPATCVATFTDFFGAVQTVTTPITLGPSTTRAPIKLGTLDAGYYSLRLALNAAGTEAQRTCSFAVVRFLDRSREEVLAGDYRFGLKMWGPVPGFDSYLAMQAVARLGLHWTRENFTQGIDELNQLPLRLIYKVEQFPIEAYDEKRYGPREEFRHRHLGWNKATVPLEAPYRKWLRQQLATLPPEHNVFEIWNEAWGRLPPRDFAQVCQWTREEIREQRPDAHVGPNLGTHREYDAEFIAAGGMQGMDILVLHPYGHPERHHVRAKLRGVRAFYETALGRPIDLYATEYGTASPPQGPHASATEERVAALNVRRSLIFYVEGLKAFMPHILGQSEKDPEDKEDWYGHFRRNMDPKPNLVTLANAARLIDGSRYVGDLFFGTDVGAFLFERDGTHLLALWTNDAGGPEDGESALIDVQVDTGVEELTLVDVVGRESRLKTRDGKLDLKLDGNTVYLVGVSDKLAGRATTQPRTDQWVRGIQTRQERTARKLPTPPVLDGRVTAEEWGPEPTFRHANSKVPSSDISGKGYVAWDDDHLYVALDMTDDHPFTEGVQPDERWTKKLHSPYAIRPFDSFDVFVGTQPRYQIPEFLFAHDCHLFFAATSEQGFPVAGAVNQVTGTLDPIPGLAGRCARTPAGWSAEVAIPRAFFREFPRGPDARIAFEVKINDADPGQDSVRMLHPSGALRGYFDDATLWSLLRLTDPVRTGAESPGDPTP